MHEPRESVAPDQGARAVMITGSSTGIGRACALSLDAQGHRVFAGVRKQSDADALRGAASARLTPVMIDVTEPDSIAQAARQVEEALGGAPLAGLVNNAGIGVGGPIEFLPLDDFRRQMEVNFLGHIAVIQAFMPLIRRGPGRIVNIGSIGGRVATPLMAPYHASKFAFVALTHCLRQELRPWGIWVCIVEPGSTRTEIWSKALKLTDQIRDDLPDEGMRLYGAAIAGATKGIEKQAKAAVPAERVAKAVAHALTARRPRTHYLVGPDAHIVAFFRWLLPDRALDKVIRSFSPASG
jgi:NAD(P)-dependent dehydrogenase (short-subunit alcohol dehydrogenase family)